MAEILAAPLPMTVSSTTGANATNALNERLGRTAQFTTGQTVTFDLGSAQAIDMAAVLATDAATGAVFRVKASNNADMSSPLVDSGDIAIWASAEAAKRIHRSNVIALSPVTARYVQFSFGSFSGTLNVGRLMVGKKFTPGEQRDYGWDFKIVDLGENRRTGTGLDNPTIRGKAIEYSWTWSGLTKAEARGVMLDLLAYAGNTADLVLCLDDAATDKHNLIGYGKLPDPVIVPNTAEDWYEAKLALQSRLILSIGAAGASPSPTPSPTPTPTPAPTPTVTKVAAVGDSITVAGGYLTPFTTAYPSVTTTKFAGSGGGVGTSADSQGTNSLWGRKDAIIAFAPQVITIYMGANDATNYGSNDAAAATWVSWITQWVTAIKAELPDVLVCVGLVGPQTADANTNTVRPFINSRLRNAVGAGIDAIIPFGEHPLAGSDAAGANTLYYPDGLHPSADAHALYGAQYLAVVGSIVAGKSTSVPTAPSFVDESNVTASAVRTTYQVTTGLGVGRSCSAASTGSGQFKRGLGALGTGPVMLMNGDVTTHQMTASATSSGAVNHVFTRGGTTDTWTLTTISNAPAASLTGYPKLTPAANGFSSTPITINNVQFGAGLPIVVVERDTTSDVTAVKINGVSCRRVGGLSSTYSMWAGPTALSAASTHTVVVEGVSMNTVVVYPATMVNIESNVENAVSTLNYVFRAGPEDSVANNSITVNGGGLMVVFGFSATTVADWYALTEKYAYTGGHFWATSLTTGVPTFRQSDYGYTMILAAGFD